MNRTEIVTNPAATPGRELAPGVEVRILASGAQGARGVTTALANFSPGSSLPSHRHPCSEVIILLAGSATVCIEGRCYSLGVCDAMHVPRGTIHSVSNPSATEQAIFHPIPRTERLLMNSFRRRWFDSTRHESTSWLRRLTSGISLQSDLAQAGSAAAMGCLSPARPFPVISMNTMSPSRSSRDRLSVLWPAVRISFPIVEPHAFPKRGLIDF